MTRAAKLIPASLIFTLLLAAVTYAIFYTQSTLTGNTIRSNSTILRISRDGSNFTQQTEGFLFESLNPGGEPMPVVPHYLYVRNTGTNVIYPKLSLASELINTSNADLSRIKLIIGINGGAAQHFSLQELLDANTTGKALADVILMPGETQTISLQAVMDDDAFNGEMAEIGNIQIIFHS